MILFRVLAVALLLVCIPASHARDASEFRREIADAKRPSGKDRVNIDAIASRHLPPGTSVDEAKAFLKSLDFSLYPYRGKNVPDGQKWWIATKSSPYRALLSEEVRVILECEDGTVLRSRGWIFLKGL